MPLRFGARALVLHMTEQEHKNRFNARYLMAALPLLLMGAGVWYYVYGRTLHARREAAPAPVPEAFKAASSRAVPAEVPQGAPATVLPEAYDPQMGIDIQGSPEFKSQVTHALKLIWMADRDSFFFLKKNLYVIRNENKTGFYLDNSRPVAAISDKNAFRSLTWCAGIIAHQGWHAWYTLTKNRKSRTVPPLPGEKDEREMDINPARFDYKGLDAILSIENKAFSYQLDILKKVGAPASETGPVFRRAPRDFKYAHDGDYSINP